MSKGNFVVHPTSLINRLILLSLQINFHGIIFLKTVKGIIVKPDLGF